MSKIKLPKEITYFTCDFDGPIQGAIETLQKYAEQYPEAVLCWDSRGYDDQNRLYLDEMRLETDEQYAKRLEREEAQAKRNLEWKKAQFEKLKKELGEE
ncbi:hypothetical protein D3C77_38030 [compost metagenome]